MKPGISGYTCVRNALELDYPISLTIESLIPLCQEVVVCDSDSTDGTTDLLRDWAKRDSRVRVINRPWENPNGRISWWVEWIQWAQRHLRYEQQMFLDADEVLDPKGYETLRQAPPERCYWLRRINYWYDVWHEAPLGTVCAHEVARFGPTALTMWSDEIHDGGQFALPEPEMRVRAVRHPELVVHHLGFLRKPEAMFKKNAAVLRYFHGSGPDIRLIKAQEHPEKHWTEFCKFQEPLLKTHVYVPSLAWAWLKERGAMG